MINKEVIRRHLEFTLPKIKKIDRRTKAWKSWKSLFDRLDKSLDEEKILREKDHEK
jgi:hypothetical protein